MWLRVYQDVQGLASFSRLNVCVCGRVCRIYRVPNIPTGGFEGLSLRPRKSTIAKHVFADHDSDIRVLRRDSEKSPVRLPLQELRYMIPGTSRNRKDVARVEVWVS